MDTRNGTIYTQEQLDSLHESLRPAKEFLLPMRIKPTPFQMASRKVGRNHECPCGSGLKFKKCHLGKEATP